MKYLCTPMLGVLALAALAPAQEAERAAKPKQEAEKEAEKPKVYKVGVQVPEELTLVDMDGKKLSMKELRGKVVVLTWYAHACPAIKTAEPLLKEMAAEYGAKGSEVVMIGIDSDKNELLDAKPEGVDEEGNPLKPYAKLREQLEKREVNFRVFVDQGNVVADLFEAKTTPHMYVLDQEGVVRYSGALDNDPRGNKDEKEYVNYTRDAVKAVLAGEKVEVSETKPYG